MATVEQTVRAARRALDGMARSATTATSDPAGSPEEDRLGDASEVMHKGRPFGPQSGSLLDP